MSEGYLAAAGHHTQCSAVICVIDIRGGMERVPGLQEEEGRTGGDACLQEVCICVSIDGLVDALEYELQSGLGTGTLSAGFKS